MTPDLLLIAAGALAAGFVNGLAGFGTALFALGFWLHALPPQQAVAMSVVVALVTGLQGLWLVRREVGAQRHRLAQFLLPSLVGLPGGAALLGVIAPGGLRIVVAGLMLLYGLFFLVRRRLPAFSRPTPVADMGVGLAGGVLGGLAGLSGALPAMWCALRPWTKQETRAVLQPFNFAILAIMAGVFAWRGLYEPALLAKLAVALVLSLCAAQLGLLTFRRIGDTTFRWLIIGLMLFFGASLMVRELL